MPNPNVFEFKVGEKTCFADPLRVRRVLLQNTLGKCWGIVRELKRIKEYIVGSRKLAEDLEKDLELHPTRQDEMDKLQEVQKAKTEGKLPAIPFDQLPRVYQKEGHEGQIAIYSAKAADLEGVLAEAAYAAFDLTPLDVNTGEGVTESEAIELLKKFLEYAEGKGERLGS